MVRCAIAGFVYFLIVFLLGFGLGTIRVLLVAPRLGETIAVLAEVPIMIAASYATCGWCMSYFHVAPKLNEGMLMGAVAFALLMAAELAMSVLLFGRSPASFVAGYRTIPGAIGFAAQMVFGLMPILRSMAR